MIKEMTENCTRVPSRIKMTQTRIIFNTYFLETCMWNCLQ